MSFFQLHGLVPAKTQQRQSEHTHIVLPCGPISALISAFPNDVDLNTLPPDKLATWAMKHHAILVTYCGATTVVPTAIGAIFSSKAALRKTVEASADQHLGTLKALRDVQEFTLQLTHECAPAAPQRQPQSGRAFLKAQRRRRNDRENRRNARHALAQDALNQLQAKVMNVQPVPTQKAEDVLNCVVLAQKSKVDEMHKLAQRLRQPASALGLQVRVTGPWPPYSSKALITTPQEAHDVAGA